VEFGTIKRAIKWATLRRQALQHQALQHQALQRYVLSYLSAACLVGTAGMPATARPVRLKSTQPASVTSTVTSTSSTSKIDRLEAANTALAKGWIDAAIEDFQAVLTADPHSLPAQLGLGQAYEKNGNLDAAWDTYQQVIQHDPTNRVALRKIGQLGEYRPTWQQAGIQALGQLLELTPNDVDAITQKALLLGFQGEFTTAWQEYSRILNAETPLPVLLKAAAAAGFSGRTATAIDLYDRILAQTPNQAEAQLNRAFFGLQSQQVTPAAGTAVLMTWAETHADTMEFANLLGALPADAQWQGFYDRVLAKTPQNLPVQRRALEVLAQKDPALARAQLKQVMQVYAQDSFIYFLQGDVARSLGDFDLAAQGYETLLQRQPDRVDVLLALGGIRFEQRRYTAAEAIFKQAIALSPDNLAVLPILADLYAAQDQPLLALKLLRQVEKTQKAQGIVDRQLRNRMAQLEVDSLRRRSFQPAWEGY
jgi:tetratricopeptide (TPR) repeat protein